VSAVFHQRHAISYRISIHLSTGFSKKVKKFSEGVNAL